jgi:hypothetical protein
MDRLPRGSRLRERDERRESDGSHSGDPSEGMRHRQTLVKDEARAAILPVAVAYRELSGRESSPLTCAPGVAVGEAGVNG